MLDLPIKGNVTANTAWLTGFVSVAIGPEQLFAPSQEEGTEKN